MPKEHITQIETTPTEGEPAEARTFITHTFPVSEAMPIWAKVGAILSGPLGHAIGLLDPGLLRKAIDGDADAREKMATQKSALIKDIRGEAIGNAARSLFQGLMAEGGIAFVVELLRYTKIQLPAPDPSQPPKSVPLSSAKALDLTLDDDLGLLAELVYWVVSCNFGPFGLRFLMAPKGAKTPSSAAGGSDAKS